MSNSSIWLTDGNLSYATTPGQSGPESNGNEGVLHLPQIFKAGALPSDSLMSYPRHQDYFIRLGDNSLAIIFSLLYKVEQRGVKAACYKSNG